MNTSLTVLQSALQQPTGWPHREIWSWGGKERESKRKRVKRASEKEGDELEQRTDRGRERNCEQGQRPYNEKQERAEGIERERERGR